MRRAREVLANQCGGIAGAGLCDAAQIAPGRAPAGWPGIDLGWVPRSLLLRARQG
jgi:hypothetical protein